VAFLKKGHGRGITKEAGRVLSSVDEDEVKKAFKGVKVEDIWGAKNFKPVEVPTLPGGCDMQ